MSPTNDRATKRGESRGKSRGTIKGVIGWLGLYLRRMKQKKN